MIKHLSAIIIGTAIGVSCAVGANVIYQHTHRLHVQPRVKATCHGTTLLWNNYDPTTGIGGNHVDENAPACGGKG